MTDDAVAYKLDIEITLPEMLEFGRAYEHFVDLLAEKTFDAVQAGKQSEVAPDTIEPDEVLIVGEYSITGYVSPNVVTLSLGWVVDR